MPQIPEGRRHLQAPANDHYTLEELRLLAAMHEYNRGSIPGFTARQWTNQPMPSDPEARKEFLLQNGPQNLAGVAIVIPGYAFLTPDHARVIMRGDTLHDEPGLPDVMEGARADREENQTLSASPSVWRSPLADLFSDSRIKRRDQLEELNEDALAGVRGTPLYQSAMRSELARLRGLDPTEALISGGGAVGAAELGELRSAALPPFGPGRGTEIPASLGGRGFFRRLAASSTGAEILGEQRREDEFAEDLGRREANETYQQEIGRTSGALSNFGEALYEGEMTEEDYTEQINQRLGQQQLQNLQDTPEEASRPVRRNIYGREY